ncbi:MAG: hypothetical protein HY002_11920 [Candidatus Rokubacteria bacterium]|nr:hypothetical protein [Candidatus Rokubacteria bacterium]
MSRLPRALVVLPPALLASACVSFVPLRAPPPRASEVPPGSATTRAEVIARFGPPDEVRASDLGQVLVYRRRVVVDANPNRYYGEDRGGRFDRYERVLLYLDADGGIVRWTVELE